MDQPHILILTPVKDAAHHLDRYFNLLEKISYPKKNIALGFLEGDSSDDTYESLAARLPQLEKLYRKCGLWKKDFGYTLPERQQRWYGPAQLKRRSTIAKSRNHLLSRALTDEDWVMWLDADLPLA